MAKKEQEFTHGYANATAKFWYSVLLTVVDIILGFVMSGLLAKYLYPYPEVSGYAGVSAAFFGIVYTACDIATWGSIERFIPEYRIKNPREMVKFVRFFIFWQSFSGLFQVTFLSIYALYFAKETALSYAIWFMLLNCMKQFPGYLGIFKSLLNAYQEYTKVSIIEFIQGNVFQRLSEIGFLLIGRYIGSITPSLGEIMCMAIFYSIAVYMDDVVIITLELHFFKKVAAKEGISVRDCFSFDIGWPVVKKCVNWGIKQSVPSLVGSFIGFYGFMLTITFLPSYATWGSLAGMAGTILWYIGTSAGSPVPLYTESLMNGKKELAQFYFSQHYRFVVQVAWMFVAILAPMLLILPSAFVALGIEYYLLAIPFIIANLIAHMINVTLNQGDAVLYGAGKANTIMILRFVWMGYDTFFQTLWLAILKIPQVFGASGVVFYMVYAGILTNIPKSIVYYTLVHKKIFKIVIAKWQTFGASAISMLLFMGLGFFLVLVVYPVIASSFGVIVAVFLTAVILALGGFYVYFPLLGLFGGFDKETLQYFEKSVEMAGYSKLFVKSIYKCVLFTCKISSLHDKHGVDPTVAHAQIDELVAIKRSAAENPGTK
nr:hypothetical protein [Candidatus Sigynarchaeota archaeon]